MNLSDLLISSRAIDFLIDSLFFFITLIIGIIYTLKKHIGYLRYYLIFFFIISHSSYNIFIKPVQDFLIPIPRTFIFYYKIIGPFSIYDCLALFLLAFVLYNCIKNIKEKHLFKYSILAIIFIKGIGILIFGILGSVIYQSIGGIIDWDVEIRIIRGGINATLLVYFTTKALNILLKETEIIIPFFHSLFLLVFLTILSEVVGSFILGDIVWQRGGHNVFLLDQTNSYLSLIGIAILFSSSTIFMRTSKFTIYVILLLILIDYHKIVYAEIGIILILIAFISLLIKKKPPFIVQVSLLASLIVTLGATIKLASTNISGDDFLTRIGQITNVTDVYVNQPITIPFGLGAGGMFKAQEMTEDAGEIRAIDEENNQYHGLQSTFQVPFLLYTKEAGLMGTILVIFSFLFLCHIAIKDMNREWSLIVPVLCIAMIELIARGLFFVDPQACLYIGILCMYIYCTKQIIVRKQTI